MKTLCLLRKTSFPAFLPLFIAVLAIVAACGGSSAPEPTAAPTQPPAATSVPDEPPEPTSAPSEPDPTAAPETPDISGRDWNVLGSPDALVTVIDYSDFQ